MPTPPPARPPALCSSSRALTSSLRLKWPSASRLHGPPGGQRLRGKCAREGRRAGPLPPGTRPRPPVHGAARRRREGSDTATLQNRLPSPRPASRRSLPPGRASLHGGRREGSTRGRGSERAARHGRGAPCIPESHGPAPSRVSHWRLQRLSIWKSNSPFPFPPPQRTRETCSGRRRGRGGRHPRETRGLALGSHGRA